jgi:hypothetical protein
LNLATQIAFDGEHANVFTDALEFSVGQVFDLLGRFDASRFADLAGAGAADAKNGGQTDLGVLMRRNVDASNTGHDFSLLNPLRLALALALLVTWISADDAHHAVTFDDLAVAADPLYRCHYLHG